jgi:hypothetical protein
MPTDELITSEADGAMALVADVHTDVNSGLVLEEAVGWPMFIYVAVPIDGAIMLARGGVFSYYEFTQPMGNRLTDEAWQAMLESCSEPAMPAWTSSFVAEEPSLMALTVSESSKRS